MSEDAACILLIEACAYIAYYIWDCIQKYRGGDHNNPFGW